MPFSWKRISTIYSADGLEAENELDYGSSAATKLGTDETFILTVGSEGQYVRRVI